MTTEDDIVAAVQIVAATVERLRHGCGIGQDATNRKGQT
jgi:hypothetical protein